MDIDAGRQKVCAEHLAKRLSSPADIQIVKVRQRVCFFFCGEIRRNNLAAREFSRFMRAEEAFVYRLPGLRILQVVVIVSAENEGTVRPDGSGVLPNGNHVAGVDSHQDRKPG